ncbi:MAG: hypothetical protein MJ137_00965 [Clostridia bacterium]|nr:hypothetical protein [Clostridia bacterium]
MGTWGYKIFQNDIAMDLKDSFDCLNRKGVLSEEHLLSEFNEIISNKDFLQSQDYADFWLAFGKLEWDYGLLSEHCRILALECTSLDKNPGWQKESYCKPNEIEKRKEELDLLRTILLSDNPKPKKVNTRHAPFVTALKKYGVYALPYLNEMGLELFLVFQVVNIAGNLGDGDDLWPVIKVFAKEYDKIPTFEELQSDCPLPVFFTPDVYADSQGINDDGKCWIRYTYTIIDRSKKSYNAIQEIGLWPLFFPTSIDEKGKSYCIYMKDLCGCVTTMKKSWGKPQIEHALSVLTNHPLR